MKTIEQRKICHKDVSCSGVYLIYLIFVYLIYLILVYLIWAFSTQHNFFAFFMLVMCRAEVVMI